MEFFIIIVDCEVLGMIEAPDSVFCSATAFLPARAQVHLDASRDNFTVLKIKLYRNSLLQEYARSQQLRIYKHTYWKANVLPCLAFACWKRTSFAGGLLMRRNWYLVFIDFSC